MSAGVEQWQTLDTRVFSRISGLLVPLLYNLKNYREFFLYNEQFSIYEPTMHCHSFHASVQGKLHHARYYIRRNWMEYTACSMAVHILQKTAQIHMLAILTRIFHQEKTNWNGLEFTHNGCLRNTACGLCLARTHLWVWVAEWEWRICLILTACLLT